ncbi:hypothetical protein Ct61P_14781 [Colletotrichum tofieldiae]|nr:hypothetical protein Ct61P_14781 [Colletotrichum tofieldiae]
MTPLNQGPLKKRDRTNENFDKATKNLMSRCDQIRQRYGADVYIQVRRKHKHYQYTSSNEPSWPKTKAEMILPVGEAVSRQAVPLLQLVDQEEPPPKEVTPSIRMDHQK